MTMQFTEEKALVIKTDRDFAYLETQNAASCGNCSTKSGCASVSSIFTLKSRNKLKINNTLGLKAGDSVIVAMPSDKLLIATFLMYVLPLISLFVFSYIAKLFFGETASILMGLGGLFVALMLLKQFISRDNIASYFQPKMIRQIINLEIA